MAEYGSSSTYPGRGILARRYMERLRKENKFVDPKQFMGSFLRSPGYQASLREYLGRTEGADATEEEKVRVFQENPETKVLLLKFAKTDAAFVYDEAYLRNNGFGNLIEPFERYVRATKVLSTTRTAEGKRKADENRRIAHTRFAEALLHANIAPTYNLARGMASIMLATRVESETSDKAIQNEIRRFEVMAEALRSQTPGNE